MSKKTTAFLNHVFLHDDRLIGHTDTGERPIYVHDNIFNVDPKNEWVKILCATIRRYGPGNTFVLAPSLRSARSPVRLLENFLVRMDEFPCYVPTADERELNQPAMSGKIVFSTFHQSKGMERDLVIVYGMEDSAIHRYTDPLTCDNKLYVALTRSKKQLIVLQDQSKPHLQFVDPKTLATYATVVTRSDPTKWLKTHPYVVQQQRQLLNTGTILYPPTTFVTTLLRHCHFEDLEKIEQAMCTYEVLHHANENRQKNIMLHILNHVTTSISPLQTEEVSDLSGTALQAWIEYELVGTLRSIGKSNTIDIPNPLSAQALLIMANDYDANVTSEYRSRRNQIRDHQHTWLDQNHLHYAWSNFSRKIDLDAIYAFETQLTYTLSDLPQANDSNVSCKIVGSIDMIEVNSSDASKVTIWELKFTAQIQSHHLIQAATYGILYWLTTGIVPTVYVYNMKTDEQIQVYLPESQTHAIDCLKIMLFFKSCNQNTVDADLFIQNAKTLSMSR